MYILIADDHDLFRGGIRALLQQLDNITICEASNRDEISAQLDNQVQPDILLLDLDMPGVGSVDNVKEICTAAPKVAVMITSGNDAPHIIDSCFCAGALGFLPKSSSADIMLLAIQTVYAGEMYIPSKIYHHEQKQVVLTPRQREVYTLLTEGNSNKEIARVLNISESTVKQHMTILFRKLDVSSRVQALQKASVAHI